MISMVGTPPARESIMHFDERMEGEYRIYAGALEGPRGDGYIAAVVINRITGSAGTSHEAFRDDSLSCGHRWPSPDAAIGYALARARQVIARERRERAALQHHDNTQTADNSTPSGAAHDCPPRH